MNPITERLCRAFVEAHPNDSARSLERLGPDGAAEVLAGLPKEAAADALGGMAPGFAVAVIGHLSEEERAEIVDRLGIHQAAALLRRLDPEKREALSGKLPANRREPLERLLRYPEKTAGARMDPNYPCLAEDVPLGEALDRVRSTADRGAFYLFVIRRNQRLSGVVSVLDLLGPDSEATVGSVKRPCERRLSALTDLDAIRSGPELMRWGALPVIDEKGFYLGAVRQRTVVPESDSVAADDPLHGAGAALGELYQIGLLGLAGSLESRSRPDPGGSNPD